MQLTGNLGRLGIAALATATLAGGWLFAAPSVHAQGPSSVPAARFYGTVRDAAGQPPVNYSVSAAVSGNTCSAAQAITGGTGGGSVDNAGNYVVDIQAVPGCTTPGATVVFTSGSLRAKETGTIPDLPGTAVHLNLTLQAPATPTAAPPAPPTVAPTRAPTQAPAPPVTATAPRAVVTPVVQAPKGPVVAQGPRGVAQAPRLPSTGTGGLLDQSSSSPAGWALVLVVVAAIGVSASGIFAYKRSGR